MSRCPLEVQVEAALTAAGIGFTTPAQRRAPTGLDFTLDGGIEIEVKRFHSPRIAAQMARAENVIALQGKEAVEMFCVLLNLVAEVKKMGSPK